MGHWLADVHSGSFAPTCRRQARIPFLFGSVITAHNYATDNRVSRNCLLAPFFRHEINSIFAIDKQIKVYGRK